MRREQIDKILAGLEEDKTYQELGRELNCHENTIGYHVRRMREQGIEIKTKKGRRPIKYDN
jgi:predicted transcriptional regulator